MNETDITTILDAEERKQIARSVFQRLCQQTATETIKSEIVRLVSEVAPVLVKAEVERLIRDGFRTDGHHGGSNYGRYIEKALAESAVETMKAAVGRMSVTVTVGESLEAGAR